MPKREQIKEFRSVADFEAAMFPEAVAQRAEREESEHPRDAGVRLAEEALSSVKPLAGHFASGSARVEV